MSTLHRLVALVSVLALAPAASAQLTVVSSTQDVYDGDGPAEVALKLGTDFNVRLGPVSSDPSPGQERSFVFTSGVAVPFLFEHRPPGTSNPPRYILTVGDGTEEKIQLKKGAAGTLVDVIMIDADSNVPGASVRLVKPVLEVPAGAGVGGSFLVPVRADGPMGDNVYSVAGPSLRRGFKLRGSIRFDWTEPLPVDAVVRLRMRTQVVEGLAADRDRDGVPNEDDNCPLTANPDQADSEIDPDTMQVVGDGIGDACDNCVALINPEQIDTDDDGFGEACDTCPSGCIVYEHRSTGANPLEKSGEDCSNAEQANPLFDDPDDDGIGRICDNCPTIFNPDQDDANLATWWGADCEPPKGTLQTDPPVVVEPAGAEGGSGAPVVRIAADETPLPPDTFRVSVDCGGQNLTASALSIRVPTAVTAVRFGIDPDTFADNSGCLLEPFDPTNPGRLAEKVSTCEVAAGLDPSLLQLTPDGMLPAGPGSRQTHLRGPAIGEPTGIDSNLVVLQLFGNRSETGFTDKILCLQGERVEVGLIRFFGLVSGLPSITIDGLDAFSPPLVALDIADGGEVPLEGLSFTTGPPEGTQAFDLTIEPTLDDASGFAEQQITLLSLGPVVQQAAFCVRAPVSVATDQLSFADCTLAGAQAFQRECPANTTSVEIGPLVDVDVSYVVPPNQSVAMTGVPSSLDEDGDGLAPDDALCVVLAGDPNINDVAVESLLGKVKYQNGAEGSGLPRIEFPPGLLDLPGVADFFEASEPVGTGDVRVVGSFDQDGDEDGDDVPNFSDNCSKVPNSDQVNSGAVLEVSDNSDSVGDACQCCDGEDANNGSCFPVDLAACQQALADIQAGLDPGPGAARCSVTGDGTLNGTDIVLLDLVLNGGGETATRKFQQVCPAATGL